MPDDTAFLDAELEARLSALPDPVRHLGEFDAALQERAVLFGLKLIPTFFRPHVLAETALLECSRDAEGFLAVLERVTRAARKDARMAQAMGFGQTAIDLFQIDHGYERCIVIGRPDAQGGPGRDMQFVEMNTDSPAMMTLADEIQDVILGLAPYDELTSRLHPEQRTPKLLSTLLGCYREWKGRTTDSPSIAIVDWPGESTSHELQRTAARFRKLGTEAFVASPSALEYRNRELLVDGRKIDLVYRRVLCKDFIEKRPGLGALLDAYRDGAVCMANPLSSFLGGTKAVLALMFERDNPLGLTADERALVERVIPETHFADSTRPSEALVYKRADGHGGRDVLLPGASHGDGAPTPRGHGWVCQRLVDISQMRVPVIESGRLAFAHKFFNVNPFLFGGRHGGSITRLSESRIVSITQGGGLLPTIGARGQG